MNERGFAMLSTLILLPLLITITALSGATYMLLRSDGATRHECRVELLRIQSLIARDLRRLLDLNPEATRLRYRRQAAEAKVAMTAATPAGAIAEMELSQVIAEQLLLAAKQQSLIQGARILSHVGPEWARQRVHRSSEKTKPRSSLSPLDFTAQVQGSGFPLVASPLFSPTPDYQPARDFSRLQEMKVVWSFSLEKFLPPWFQKHLPITKLKASARCSATIKEESGQWQARLTADK